MRRPKRGPALFELLSERGLKAPEDQGAQGVPVETSARVAETVPGKLIREPLALTPAPLSPRRIPDPRGEGECVTPVERLPAERLSAERSAAERSPVGRLAAERLPVLVVDGERLHVSLTSMSAAGAAFVLLALIALCAGLGFRQGRARGLVDGFAAGRASYVADTATEIEAARLQSPATYLVGGLLDVGASPALPGGEPRLSNDVEAGAAAREAGWIDGFTYVVAQEFSAKNVSDVEPAQRFLAEHGVETRSLPLSSGGVRLITTQGFDRKDPAQRKLADQLLEKIRAIGAQYFASGGRYKLEGYFKTLTGD